MNDLDKTIRNELERMVPVTGEPDWNGVTNAAALLAKPLVNRHRHVLWVALASLASLVIVGVAVAAVGKLPWWQRGSHPQAVIADVYKDGRLGREWNCPSLRAAISKLPEDIVKYSNLDDVIIRASARRCEAALTVVPPSSSEQAVRTALGPPDRIVLGLSDRITRCWLYSWKPITFRPLRTDVRVCFRNGQLASIGHHL